MYRRGISNVLGKITVLVMVGLCLNTAMSLDGSGTKGDPWRIKSVADFNEFAANEGYWDTDDYTRLETDVNLAGRTYSTAVIAPDTFPGTVTFNNTPFRGIFDGNGHKIINLTINGGADVDHLGLFGNIHLGTVKNLGLVGGSVSGGDWNVGGLVGCIGIQGNISNCYSTCDVNSFAMFVGGLAGRIEESGVLSECYSAGNIKGGGRVGGLIGYNTEGIISDCYSAANVNGEGECGGILGLNDYGSVWNCYSTGNISGDVDVGGLVGYNYNYSVVSKCYSISYVNGGGGVGGLVGDNHLNSVVSNCYSTGEVSGDDSVGGLVGINNVSTITNCYSIGDVNGASEVGGLLGYNFWSGSISNCYSAGDVSGDDNVGGLVGINEDIVRNCFWDTSTQTHGVSISIGLNEGDVYNVAGLSTEEMQTRSTFTDAGWDFVGEIINGTEDIWTIHEEVDYPKFVWELVNFVGWYEVDFRDYSFFANRWMDSNCGLTNDCDGTDLDFSDKVDGADLKIFFNHWLEGTGN